MLKLKGKIIDIESDEEIDLYLYMLRETLLDPQISPSDVDPSNTKSTLRQPSLEVTPPPSGHEPSGDKSGQTSSFDERPSSSGVESHDEESDNVEGGTEPIQPAKKNNLGHMIEANSYPMDFIRCSTTQNDLYKLNNLYRIPNNIHLVILEKKWCP